MTLIILSMTVFWSWPWLCYPANGCVMVLSMIVICDKVKACKRLKGQMHPHRDFLWLQTAIQWSQTFVLPVYRSSVPWIIYRLLTENRSNYTDNQSSGDPVWACVGFLSGDSSPFCLFILYNTVLLLLLYNWIRLQVKNQGIELNTKD